MYMPLQPPLLPASSSPPYLDCAPLLHGTYSLPLARLPATPHRPYTSPNFLLPASSTPASRSHNRPLSPRLCPSCTWHRGSGPSSSTIPAPASTSTFINRTASCSASRTETHVQSSNTSYERCGTPTIHPGSCTCRYAKRMICLRDGC